MAVSSIDTHKFVRRLEQAGMPLALAEVQAEVFNEAFAVNLESLVTKEFLESKLDARFSEQKFSIDARFAEQQSYVDARFSEQQSYVDARFAEQQSYVDARFAEQQSQFEARFAEQKAYIDSRVAELLSHIDTGDAKLAERVDANFRLQNWMLGFIVLVLILPYLERVLLLQ